MAIALGTQVTGNTSGTTQNVNLGSCATGDLIVVCLSHRTDVLSGVSVSDPTNGAYTVVATNTNTAMAYFQNSQATGTLTITVSHTGSSAVVYVNASRWTGAATSSALDTYQTGSTSSTTSHAGPSITASGAGLILSASGFSASSMPYTGDSGDGFTALSNTGGREFWQYKITTGETVTPNVTSTGADNGFFVVAAFKEAGGGGATPTITDAGDETYTNGETGITITGTNFGASQGTGTVKISPTDNVADSNAVTQTVTSWGDTSITFTAVRSTLAPSTNLYLFVTANGGYSNASGHVVSFLQVVTVTNVSDTTLNDGQTSVTITGTDFQSTQGTGRVVISPTSDINNAGAVAQTVTSWGDTSITFTAVRGSLSLNTNLYLFVENDDDVVNSTGYTVQFVGIKKLLVQLPTSAVGVTGISGVVWTKPGDTTQAGTEIGEFTGQSFESSAVGGYAVLKVPVSAFNGSSLTTSDTPVVLVQSSTHTTGLIEATIIEE